MQVHVEVLLRRLGTHSGLTAADRAALQALPAARRDLSHNQAIAYEGEMRRHCTIVVSGWMASHRLMEDGRRQILAFHFPGEVPDAHCLHTPRNDIGLAASGACTVAHVAHGHLNELLDERPNVARALVREGHVQACILRTWLANVGGRQACERLAHFLCEAYVRLAAIGQAGGHAMRVPANQTDIADALGMTNVHVNRVLGDLRRRGLVEWRRAEVAQPDWDGLCGMAGFDPAYLMLPPGIGQVRERTEPVGFAMS